MKEEARKLRLRSEETEREYRKASKELKNYIESCQHAWGETVYDPKITESYVSPGDPPGTMGVDWRGPTYVPAGTEDRWKRECEDCGLVEYTKGIIEKTERRVPKWPQK